MKSEILEETPANFIVPIFSFTSSNMNATYFIKLTHISRIIIVMKSAQYQKSITNITFPKIEETHISDVDVF